MSRALARALVRVASILVPASRRAEWLEEWRAELDALDGARRSGATGLPGAVGFALGAWPHAVWTRMEGWTMDGMLQDLRYSTRVLVRAPGFTIVAMLTLALGVGANASIFSLVNGLVLRWPAGIEHPDRLVQLARSYETDPRWDNFSWRAMKLIGEEAPTLSGVAGYEANAFVVGRGADSERVVGQLVTGSYFAVLGVRPHVGRLLQPADDVEPGAHPVAVLSHSLWVRRYGADPDVVGASIEIGSTPYDIVGVAPEGFAGVQTIGPRPEIFLPTMMHPGYRGELPFDSWGTSWIEVFGRLAEGVSLAQLRASLDVVTGRLREADPVNEGILVLVAPGVGLDPGARAQAGRVSMILLLIVGLVLLLTCTNVANLFLARASTRRTEVGVRLALGAGRGRLVRQLVTESTLVALGATVIALPLVAAAGDLLPVVFPYALAVSLEADGRVYAFLVAIGLLAGFLFGVAPAWSASRRALTDALREGASTAGRARTRLRDGLVVSQLGVSLALVACAGLLGRSVLNARLAEPGFEPRGVTAAFVDLFSPGRYDEESGRDFFERLLATARERPNVRSATIANQIPIAGGHSRSTVRPAGRADVEYEAERIVVGGDYFGTLGIPVLRGRPLGGFDAEPERVVVVNEALASMFWPGEDPIGRELEGDPGWRVVGLVQDVQMRSLRAPGNPAVYYPVSHAYSPFMALQVSSESGRAPPATELRDMVATVDANLPVSAIVDVHAAMTQSMGETRTIGYLVAAFAVLALALAVVGLYGLVSYGASQRIREIGIRIALGAEPDSLIRLILAKGIAVAVLGVALGLLVSLGLGRALGGLLYGVSNTDVVTLGASALVLVSVAGIAAWVPARRAARVDAAASLRDG